MTKCNKKSVTKFASLFIITLTAVGVANPDAAHGTLTGYWAFDGNYSDGSGNGHTATPHGDAALVGGGLFGGAVSLDGNGDWVDVADHADHEFSQGTDFSLTLFYKGPNSDSNNGLLTKGYANNPRDPDGYYLLQVTNPNLFEFDSRCCAGSTPRVRSNQIGPDITDNEWHNVTVVRDYGANQLRAYIDGDLEWSKTMGGPLVDGNWNMGVNGEALTIGDHLDRFTTGLFDDVAIFKGQVLSQSDIEFITNNGVAAFIVPAVPEPGSIALAALGFLSLGLFGWRNRRGSRALIAERAQNNSKGTGTSVTSRIRPERNAAASAHILATVALVTTLLSVTCTYAAPLQVDIQASGATTQGGWQPWNFSTTSSSSAVSTTFAYADATDGTVDVSIDPLFSAQGRNYGLSNVTDPGNLTIPDVWADQYFWNNNVNGSGTLTLDDLKAGTYSFTSYHYANSLAASSNDDGTASVQVDTGGGFVDTGLDVTFISGINGYTPVTAVKLDALATVSFQFTVANDNDQIQVLYGPLSDGDTFGPNGFELESLGGGTVPEPSTFALTALGLLSLSFVARRRRRRAI